MQEQYITKVEIKMKCNYCLEKIISSYFTCPCDYNVVACSKCCQFPCYKCQKRLKRYQAQFCGNCRKFVQEQSIMFKDYTKYCIQCLLHSYNSSKQKNIKISYHSFRRQQVQSLLINFCVQCRKFLKEEEKQNFSPLRVSNQSMFKRCHDCLVQDVEKQRPKQNIMRQESIIPSERKQQNKPALRYRQKTNQISQSPTKNKEEQYELRKKWKEIQGSSILSCMSCERSIFSTDRAHLSQQMVICSLCSQMSKIQEKSIDRLNNSRIISSLYGTNDKKQLSQAKLKQQYVRKAEKQQLVQPFSQENINSNKKKQSQIKQELKQESTNKVEQQQKSFVKQTSIKPSSEGKQPQVIQLQQSEIKIEKKKQIKRPQSKQPQLKKCDSQKIIQNIDIQIKLTNDQDLIECDECGIYIQPTSSIWQEQSNKPLCRCCFADLIRQIQQQQRKNYYNRFQKQDNIKYRRKQYMQKSEKPLKKQGNQNVIDMPIGNEIKSKYEEKKFQNTRQQSTKKIKDVQYQQQQRLKRQLQQQEKNRTKNMRASSQYQRSKTTYENSPVTNKYEGITNKIQSWNERIKLNPGTSKIPVPENSQLDLVDSIKKKMQQNQLKNQNTSFKLGTETKNSYTNQIQDNRRYKSSYKPIPASNQQLPVNDSKPSRNQYSYLEPQKTICQLCLKSYRFTKQYIIGDKLVCLDCISQHNGKLKRRQGTSLFYK